MRPILRALCGLTLGVACACTTTSVKEPQPLRAAAVPSARGGMLYENHCTGCHTSVVHVQENHRATSDVEVEAWVRRWAVDQKLEWTDEDVLDVTDFLLNRYYSI